MNKDQVIDIVDKALRSISCARLQQAVKQKLIDPKEQQRIFEWSSSEYAYTIWVIADLGVANVGIAYTQGGFAHGEDPWPWGLIGLDDEYTGPLNNWYQTLEDCANDSGDFD